MSLELKRKKLDLMRIQTARADLEFKVEERLDEIKRLQDHVKIQIDAEEKLKNEIQDMERK